VTPALAARVRDGGGLLVAEPPWTSRLAAAVREGGGLLVAAPLWLWWSVDRGGYLSPLWVSGLLALALATAIALVVGPRPPLRGAQAVAVGALAAYAAISALSILVASDRGLAWLSSERALLYALAFALPTLWPPSLRAVRAGVAVWVGATLAALVVALTQARAGVAIDGRLTDPTSYPNATGALLLMGALPAVMLACLPGCPAWQRSLGLAAAGALAAGALLTQSRGILIVGAVAAAGAVLAGPARLRLAAGGVCVLVALAWQHDALLDLRREVVAGHPADGVAHAAVAIAVIAVVLAGVGLAWSALERRGVGVGVVRLSPRLRRRLRLAGVAVAAAAAVGLALGVSGGRPAAWAHERLQDLRTPDYHRVEMGSSRFGGGLGSNRFDYWRVAVAGAAAHPLRGTGAGSFAESYLVERRTASAPAYAHQVWLGAAAELGLGGLAALLTFVVALAVALLRSVRGRSRAEAGLLAAAVAPLAVLLTHASADWTFAFPGLAVPALGLAGGAVAARRAVEPSRGDLRRRLPAAVVALALAASAVPLAIAEQFVQRAELTTNPASARADLRRAMRWAPLSGRPPLVLALLELEQQRPVAARRAFLAAHERDPDAWFPLLELAVLTPSSRQARALGLARRSAARNPRDPLVAEVRRALARGERPSPRDVARRALEGPG